jgi:hypothetical protein
VVVAWLRELEESDPDGNAVCTGRFECECEDEVADELPFPEAVAWARERAARAYADIELERYVVIGEDREIPPLPEELADRIAAGPRRPAGDEWRDRADDAPPVRWEVEVELSPPDLSAGARPENEAVVERVAGRVAAAAGCDDVTWAGDELDAGLADIESQRPADGQEEFGWMTTHRLAFVLTASAEAPTHRPVLARVRAAVLDELEAATGRTPYERATVDIEDRWGVEADVRPPGYEWRPPAL